MTKVPDISRRLLLLGIDAGVRDRIRGFHPVLRADIRRLANRFYDHMLSMPEGQAIFGGDGVKARLLPKQEKHWLHLFSCAFDEAYVANAIHIGAVHFRTNVPPYLYLAGYNYFQCELIGLAASAQQGAGLPPLLTAITRLVTLDTDLALSAYTRAFWGQRADPPASAVRGPKRAAARDDDELVFVDRSDGAPGRVG